jgi:hypothetical protein
MRPAAMHASVKAAFKMGHLCWRRSAQDVQRAITQPIRITLAIFGRLDDSLRRPDGAVRLPAHTGPIGFSPTNQIHG